MARTIRRDLDGVVTAYEHDSDGRPIGAPYTLHPGQEVPDGVRVGEHVLTPVEGEASAGAFDPSSANVVEVNEYLEQASPAERARVLAEEAAGHARKGILDGPYATQTTTSAKAKG